VTPRRRAADIKIVKRPTVLYAETYAAPGAKLKAECLPTLPSAAGFTVFEAYILKAGRMERDGETFEFQDVRVYLRESP